MRPPSGASAPKAMALIIKRIRTELRQSHDPVRAVNEKRYLKSPYRFFGVPVPVLRAMARGIRRDHEDASREFVFDLSHKLWRSPYHQEKSLAIMVLEQYPQYLNMEAMPTLEDMLGQCAGWDHTDWISTRLVAHVLEGDEGAYGHLKKWANGSAPLWVRRASLISQIPLLRKGRGDRDLFFTLAEGMLDEKDFFIRKAIGWTIREVAKADPGAARDFLMSIKGRASGLTLREGARRLPVEMKKEVLA